MRKHLFCLSVVWFYLLIPINDANAQATFEGLGFLVESIDQYSLATGVSADGSIVTGTSASEYDGMVVGEAFRWENGEITGIGMLFPPPGVTPYSRSNNISADGTTIVGYSTSFNSIPGLFEAMRWTLNTGMEGLGDLTPSDYWSESLAVSDNGSVVVGRSYMTGQAFRWENGVMESLSVDYTAEAWGVSADGSIVVGTGFIDGTQQAFRWTQEDGMQGLGSPIGGYSVAYNTSANGNIIVGYQFSSSVEAFKWDEVTGMIGLGFLPGGSHSEAKSISANGDIIVGFSDSNLGSAAFIWSEETGMQNLKELLENEYGLNLAGWSLFDATAVSADGKTIVGVGINPDGYSEAYRVTLPESTPCLAPSDISFSIVTPTTANVSWVENGSSFTWEIEYGESGFIQGSGTTVIDNDGFLGETLTDLTPSTQYDVYVRSHCTNGESDWTGPVSFFTADAPLCIPPSNISVSVVTDTVVFVSWTENGSASEWEIEYGESGFMQGEGLVVIDNDGVPGETIGGLTQGVSYDVYVRSVCEFTESNWEGPTSFVIEPEPCSAPSEVSVDNVSPIMVYVNWTENGSANEWELEYGESGFVQGEGTVVIDNDGVTGEAISGLEPETDYEVYVRSICEFSESEWTGPIPFTTEGELGINENIMDKVVLYPNPTTGIINIKTEEPITQAGVYTITGSKLPVQLSETGNTIDISDFSTGLYFVKITVNNQSQTFKVIKQ